jgi:uncharacterized protein
MKKFFAILSVVIVVLILFLGIALTYAIENVFPYSPIRPHRLTPAEIGKLYPGVDNPGSVGLKYMDFDVDVEKGIILKGWFVFSHLKPARGTIVLLHGIASCRYAMIPMAKALARSGFNSILYDSRANGESGGVNCTFGYFEKIDLRIVLDAVQERFSGAAPFGVYGNSLGAAVAVQALAIEKRLRCGVVESCFATLRGVIHDYSRRMILLPINSIPDAALRRTERIASLRIDDVKPEASARFIVQPIMVIHGLKDAHIKAAYGRRVFDNIASPVKLWVPIPTGTHYNLAEIGGTPYLRSIVDFFITHISEK